MRQYLQKFDKLYKGKQSIKIRIFDESPLTKKYARYNQGGEACACLEGTNKARQKSKDGYKNVMCNLETCQYRQRNEQGKCVCNRIAWFKFLMPDICTDRIFLMRITGQTSINRIDDYFKLQKAQGNTIKGDYILYLKQEEQTNSLAKSFNNYVLDILKEDNYTQSTQISRETIISDNQSQVKDKNVKKVVKQEETKNIPTSNAAKVVKQENNTENKPSKKATPKKETKSKVTKKEETATNTEKNEDNQNYYALIKVFNKSITSPNGTSKEYLFGEFADMNDEIHEIAIKPEDAEELSSCDLGTFVKLDILTKGNLKFAMKIKYITRLQKKIAA